MQRFRPQIHKIKHTSITGWLNRQFPKRPLFVFFHTQAGNWVIGEWVPGGRMVEVEVIGPSLDDFTREQAQRIQYQMRTPAAKYVGRLRERLVQGMRARDRRERDDKEQRRKYMVWLSKQMKQASKFWEFVRKGAMAHG